MGTTLEIWEDPGDGTPVLKYTPDNIISFEITKSSNLFPFSLPFVKDTNLTGTDVKEHIDIVAISGVEANISLSFWIPLSAVSTLLSTVSNWPDIKHEIRLYEWSGTLTNYIFYGRIGSVRLHQEGGTPSRLIADVSFMSGSVVDFGLGIDLS